MRDDQVDVIWEQMRAAIDAAQADGLTVRPGGYGIGSAGSGVYRDTGCRICPIGALLRGRVADPNGFTFSVIRYFGGSRAFWYGVTDGFDGRLLLPLDSEDRKQGHALGIRALAYAARLDPEKVVL